MAAVDAPLRRRLGLPGLSAISIGAMISSGLFVLPGLAYAIAGPAVIFAYLLAGLTVLPTVLSKAELATAMPRAGGTYYFVDRALGPLAGTISGFAAWFSLSVKTAFAFVGIRIFAELVVPGADGFLITFAACLLFTLVNLRGIGHAGVTQIILVSVLLLILLGFSAYGVTHLNAARFRPLATDGFSGILKAAALVFVAFGGLTKATSVSEEARKPSRDIPTSFFISLLVVTLVYFSCVLVCVGTLDPKVLGSSLTPLSEAGRALAGSAGFAVLGMAAVMAFLTTANAGIMSAARFPLAMSRDHLLPAGFGLISRKRGTPWVSVLMTSGFIVVILTLELEALVKLASAMQIFLFILVNVAVIVMRESRIHTYRPSFRSPAYPWIQIAGILVMSILLYTIGVPALIACISVAVGGSVWYFLYSRKRVIRESALLHLAARISPRELGRDGLVRELRQVLRQRDEIVEDRFDALVTGATILDLCDAVSMEQFLKRVAGELGPDLGTGEDELFDLLLKRERESTTALRKGLAIPHVIVPGTGRFSLLLARCTDGIDFGGENSPVHMVFVLSGSLDERQFHLRALMAIAEVTSAPGFDAMWMKCKGPEELRDLVLLSQRRREMAAGD
jgi:amino acid transporter/mannitol/fructose-specific phosphotransferase system IIA component (Ntr-type)